MSGGTWIRELAIENFGIIRSAQVELTPGFNAVTGESGAGKSLLVSALDTAFGSRAQADTVGPWAPRARVRLAVEVLPDDPVWTALANLGVAADDVLLIQREWGRDGKGVLRVQGQAVPVGQARAALAGLVDLSGQHEHQRLGEPGYARIWLDEWVDAALKQCVADAWAERAVLMRDREALAALQSQEASRREWQDDVATLSALAIDPAADARLAERVARARAGVQLAGAYQGALDEVERAGAALAAAERLVSGAVELDPPAGSALELLRDAQATVGEVRHEVYQRAADVDQDAGEAAAWVERLDRLARARRRYDTDLEGLVRLLAERQEQLAALDEVEFRLSRLDERIEAATAQCQAAAARLSAARQAQAADAAAAVSAALPDLDLPGAVFEFAIQPGPLSANGTDVVAWRFSANPGQDPRPLHRVASGGERARVLLALNLVKGTAGPLVFDELDQGLGGHAAARVAGVLEELGHRQQVVVVSHQALVAARADCHWRIVKRDVDVDGDGGGSTLVRIAGRDRVDEIARMLSGSATDVARRHAEDLLALTGGGTAD